MSRTLSKILLICALVVVVPLMVVGTTLAAYFSINNTVKVATYVVDDNYAIKADGQKDENGNEFFAGYSYAGQEKISGEINAGHAKTVQVSAAYDEKAYKFEGWFRGTLADYSTALSQGPVELNKENTLDVKMADEGAYLAVYSVYKFNITYTYDADPEHKDVAQTTETVNDVVYGAALKDLSDTYHGELYHFNSNGWKFGETNDRFTRATFDQKGGAVSLSDPWQDAAKVNLNYYGRNGQRVYTEEIQQGAAHTLLTVEELNAKITNDITIDAGYTYFWKDKQGSKITEVNTSEVSFDVYLDREAIEYTATLEVPDWVTFNGTTSINFTVEDNNSKFAEWIDGSKWSDRKYSFWYILPVFDYNGTSYKYATETLAPGVDKTLNDFITTLVNESPKQAKTATLEIQEAKNFTQFKVSGAITGQGKESAQSSRYSYPYIFKGNEEINYDFTSPTDTTQTVANLLGLDGNTFYGSTTSQGANKIEVELTAITLVCNGSTIILKSDDWSTMTLNDLIEKFLEKNPIEGLEDGSRIMEVFDVTSMTLEFVKKA